MCDTRLFVKKKMYEDGKIKSNIFLIIVEILKKFTQFKKNVATRSSNLASHQIFYFIRNWKSIHSREKKWHL